MIDVLIYKLFPPNASSVAVVAGFNCLPNTPLITHACHGLQLGPNQSIGESSIQGVVEWPHHNY